MPLKSKHIRWLNGGLVLGQVLFLSTSVAAVSWALQQPPMPTTPAAPATRPASHATTDFARQPLAWYSPIWERDLRQSPVPPKPEKKPEPVREKPKPPPPLKIRLLGTVVESGDRFGLFLTGKNSIVLRRLREEVEEWTVVAIERGRVQLKAGTRVEWLRIPDYDRRIGGN